MTTPEQGPLKPLYDILAQAAKQQLPFNEAATLIANALHQHEPPNTTDPWHQTQDLANALLLDPLKGMEHIAQLCSDLCTLTKQGLNDQDHKYNCLKSATDITGHLLDDMRERFAELKGPTLLNLRAKLAEHDTMLADLFGAAPTKLTARVNSLDTKITAAIAASNVREEHFEHILSKLANRTAALTPDLDERLANLEDHANRAHARIDDLAAAHRELKSVYDQQAAP